MTQRDHRVAWLAIVATTMAALQGCSEAVGGGGEEKAPDSASAATSSGKGIPVDVAVVTARPFDEWSFYTGRLEAVDEVQIRPLVSGQIVGVDFKDGTRVAKGASLFRIDARPYRAALDKAAADVAGAEANVRYAAGELVRAESLVAQRAIAKRQYEEVRHAGQQAEAALLAAKAALQVAQFNLEHTQVRAPIAGRVSKANVTVGNVVSNDPDSPLVLTSLVATDQVYATFNVDEAAFLDVVAPKRAESLEVLLGLLNDPHYSRRGTIEFIDNKVDVASGTIRLRAAFDNADGALVPGMYARIRLQGRKNNTAMLVTDEAIGRDQNRTFVLVVDGLNRAHYREVSLGGTHEGMRIVTRGLTDGERLIVAGMQRVRSGELVAPTLVGMTLASR